MLAYLLLSIFSGIIIPTILSLLIPPFSIKLLEIFKIYKKGTLKTEVRNIITDEGFHKRQKIYLYTHKNIIQRFESGRVFGWLVLIFLPISIIGSMIIYLLN